MSRVVLISPKASVSDTIRQELRSNGNDYSVNTIVFPERRPGYYLRKAIADELGQAFIPPRILSTDDFVADILAKIEGSHYSAISPFDCLAVLFSIHKQFAHAKDKRHFSALDYFLPLGFRLLSELEEVKISRTPKRRIDEILASLDIQESYSPLQLYDQFYAQVEARGLMTRSMMYAHLADIIGRYSVSQQEQLIIVGIFGLTGSEWTIFKHLLEQQNVLMIFREGEGISGQLKELGISTFDHRREEDHTSITFTKSPDSHGQIFALAARLHSLCRSEKEMTERDVIVLPTAETLFPLLQHVLPGIPGGQFNISMGYPLRRTPLAGFLGALFEVIETTYEGRLYAPAYLRFALHPYTKNIFSGKRTDVTRILFHSIEERLIREPSLTFFEFGELEDCTDVFAEVAIRCDDEGYSDPAEVARHLAEIHRKTIRPFLELSSIGDAAKKLIDLLTFVYERTTAQRHPYFVDYAGQLFDSLKELSRSTLARERFDSLESYCRLLRATIELLDVPFAGTPLRGLQVLGFLEARNIQFKRVFFMDANEDRIPGSKPIDVFLTNSVRELLNLPSQRSRDEILKYYFDVLVHGAEEAHLLYVESDSKEKSRFVEKLIWNEQQHNRSLEHVPEINTISYQVALGNSLPTSIPKTSDQVLALQQMTFSSTSLDTYLRCPREFYFRYVMHVDQREELDEETDQRDAGIIVHGILKTFFLETKGKKLDKKALDPSRLEQVIDRIFTERYGQVLYGGRVLLKEQVRLHLLDFIEKYQKPKIADDIQIVDVEKPIEGRLDRFRLRGTIDRIDKRGTKYWILDYKTGIADRGTPVDFEKLSVNDRSTWATSISSVQLPAYALMIESELKASADAIEPAYVYLGSNEIDESIEVKLYPDSIDRKKANSILQEIILEILKEICSIEKPFAAGEERALRTQCPRCAFSTLCGTQWIH